jgi:hypothetical protein
MVFMGIGFAIVFYIVIKLGYKWSQKWLHILLDLLPFLFI